uniref:Uncharacterized protein n=1 Tax=Plectus sambesii TaxID=2011161 RepID=A0A914W3I8_9BILA
MFERCFSWYASLLNRHPFLVLIFTGLLCTVASAFAGWANYGAFSWNPEIGFETRGTEYAGRRLAWEALLNELFAVNGKTQEVKYKQRVERDAEKAPSATPQWALQFLNAVASTPCSSYEVNVPQMEYLSQVVFQVPTFDALFSMDVMGELCALHGAIQRPMEHFAFLTPFRNTWTLPNYATCLSPLLHLNCSFVTREDIEHLRRTVLFCGQFRRQIIACTTAEGPCDQLPSNCSSKLVHDLFFRILPENIMDPSVSPVFVNVFLPIYSYEGYRTAGYREATVDKFQSMNRAIMDYADNCTHIALKGVYMDLKMVQFGHRMGLDTRWGILAIILVVAIIYGYCGSIFYTLMIVVSMAFSCGTAFFMYTTVFGIKFFPFMNFLVGVLLVGIGSDDTFVLSFIFARSIRETDGMINRDTVYSALSHSALSMFVTSATTAVAFYANVISDVIVIRCFGIYAGTTMMLNYILVVTWLPAALIVLHRYINPACVRIAHLPGIRLVVEPLAKANGKVNRTIGSWVRYCMEDALPFVVNKGKYVWLVGLTGLMVGGTMISFYSPGLRLPERNPLQLFKNSHPFECLAVVWLDFSYFVCFFTLDAKHWPMIDLRHGERLNWTAGNDFFERAVCHRNPYGIEYLIILLPFWIRFVQCIRRCFDTKKVTPHLANAGKYATAFAVVGTAVVANRNPSAIYHAVHLAALFIATAYRLAWDIFMDWGLLDRNWQESNALLREKLLYRRPSLYYFAMTVNTMLRFFWLLPLLNQMGWTMSPIDAQLMLTVSGTFECFRRFVWNFFRVENEHVNNCGHFRVQRDVSIRPLVPSDFGRKKWSSVDVIAPIDFHTPFGKGCYTFEEIDDDASQSTTS